MKLMQEQKNRAHRHLHICVGSEYDKGEPQIGEVNGKVFSNCSGRETRSLYLKINQRNGNAT